MTISKQPNEHSNVNAKKKPEINYFVIFGDSLSDGKNMGEKASFLGSWARWLWLKMLDLDKSPKERFTNGYTWADALKARLVSKFANDAQIEKDSAHGFSRHNMDNADISDDVISKMHADRKKFTWDEVYDQSVQVKRKKREQDAEENLLVAQDANKAKGKGHVLDSADAADAILAHDKNADQGPLNAELQESSDDLADKYITDPRYSRYVQDSYTLDSGRKAHFNGQVFLENNSQGGSTSHNYKWSTKFLSIFSPFRALKLFFTRLIVSSLPEQITQFLKNNEQREISQEQKDKTLVTLFSGANDLITANSRPMEAAADLAVKGTMDSLERLLAQGYSHVVVCNAPDLSLTPRFQNSSDEERANARKVSEYFNAQLKLKYNELKARHPNCSIELFDIGSVFSEIYQDVLTHGEQSKYAEYFDQGKLKEPYIASKDFQITPEGTSPGCKHMFWDDVHPTATMHALLMERFVQDKKGLAMYDVSAPKEQPAEKLCHLFREKYHEKLQGNFLGLWSYSRKGLPIDYTAPQEALMTILNYALKTHTQAGDYVREAMSDLGWWSEEKGPNLTIPAIADAMYALDHKSPKEVRTSSPAKMASLLNVTAAPTRRHDLELDPVVVKKLECLKHRKELEPAIIAQQNEEHALVLGM
ncbi:MAG: SGNH/GDSL hydrolase family protein [Legionella sp.]|uniref:SGNH/GDSL hydrolase family protein n=1 Tax=Legionella sp. TaxID=459 RepID=UPI00283EEC16|nr:SGNH/GDSL hydrolase family protein [Legionella sp.]